MAAELTKQRGPASDEIPARLAEVDRAIAERKAETDRYLTLYGRGTIPVETLDAKVDEVQAHLVALRAYRGGLVEEERRADAWEQEMCGVIEALVALRERLNGGLPWEERRFYVELLVKGIVMETKIDEGVRATRWRTWCTASSGRLRRRFRSRWSWNRSSTAWRKTGRHTRLPRNSANRYAVIFQRESPLISSATVALHSSKFITPLPLTPDV